MDRNEVALKILCAFLSAENYRGQLDRATTIAGAYVWADKFIAMGLEAVPAEFSDDGPLGLNVEMKRLDPAKLAETKRKVRELKKFQTGRQVSNIR